MFNRRHIVFLVAFAMAALGAAEAYAMGKVCLFSEIEGMVLDRGKPVEGAEVERAYEWAWGKKSDSDKAVTDSKGAFHFKPVYSGTFLGGILPPQPMIAQTVTIRHNGKTYQAWAFDKMDYESGSEAGADPIKIACHLDYMPAHLGGKNSPYGLCERRDASGK